MKTAFNDLTIFGLRSIFEYGFVEDPDKAILKLLRHGVRPILAVAEKYRPVKTVVIALSGSMESARDHPGLPAVESLARR